MTHPLDALESRYQGRAAGGFALLANVASLHEPDVRVAEDLVLRRPTQGEIGDLQLLLGWLGPRELRELRINPYEYVVNGSQKDAGMTVINYQLVTPDRYRYFLVEFGASNISAYQLERASCLTTKAIELGPELLWTAAGSVGAGSNAGLDRAIAGFRSEGESYMLTLDKTDTDDLSEVLVHLREHPQQVVTGAIDQLLQLRRIDRFTPIRFLGCFAILESLLSHKPQDSDPYQALGRQIRKKLALLRDRFKYPLVYKGDIGHDAFWKKMYQYRSAIAHGDFSAASEPPAGLGTRAEALAILEGATSRVIRAALYEPQLLADLREC